MSPVRGQRPQRIAPTGARQGLSREAINLAVARQGGKCVLCGRPLGGAIGMEVDHDHALAAAHGHPHTRGCRLCFRGVLCRPCNSMLGFARDDADVLRRASIYVERYRERRQDPLSRTETPGPVDEPASDSLVAPDRLPPVENLISYRSGARPGGPVGVR